MSKKSSTPNSPPRDYERTLPANLEAEQFVLGSVLLSGGSVFSQASAILEPADFHLEKHRRIWGAMGAIAEEGDPIEYVTVATRLMFHGQLESCDGVAYLSQLTEGLPKFENIESYCRVVKEASERRRLIFLAQTMMGMALDGAGSTAAEIASRVITELVGVGQRALGTETLAEFVKGFEGGVDRLLTPSRWAQGISTGFTRFDEMTTGLQRNDLILIGARPSMGKTALAINVGLRAAKDGKRVVMFSAEMAKVAIFHRMICSLARVDSHRFRGGFLNQEERRRLNGALNQLVGWKFHLNDTAGAMIEEIRAECGRLRVRFGQIDLVIVDYLQLLATKAKTNTRNDEVTLISKALKQLARDMNCPVVALSQLSRASDRRNERPRLSDLRESGSLEQDADVVAFIYREEVYKPDREDLYGLAELIIAKQRNGPTGTVELAFLHSYTRFENRAADLGEEPASPPTFGGGNREWVKD